MSSDVSPVQKGVRSAFAIIGIVSFVIGIIMLFFPVTSAKFLVIVFAIWMIVAGFVYLGAVFAAGDKGGWARVGSGLLGIIYIAAGIIVFFNLSDTTVFLAIWVAIFIGVLWIFQGFAAFGSVAQGSSGWNIAYGILSIIAGAILIFSPMYSVAVLWMLLAISLIVVGIAQFILSFSR